MLPSSQNEFSAVSFTEERNKLSRSQDIIFELLTDKLSKKEPINRDDIIDAYFKAVSKDGKTIRVRSCLYSTQFFQCLFVDRSHPEAKKRAITWFKDNLGGCILKGKMLIIPVINIK